MTGIDQEGVNDGFLDKARCDDGWRSVADGSVIRSENLLVARERQLVFALSNFAASR